MRNLFVGMGKAIISGSLSATAMILVVLVLQASPHEAVDQPLIALTSLGIGMFWILLFAIPVVSLACLVTGLPLVWLLDKAECACAEVGALAGAMVGASLVLVPAMVSGSEPDNPTLLFALITLAGGGVTGWVWGTRQEQLHQEERNRLHPNRIDDPRILR